MRGEEGGADWGAGVSGVKENQSQRFIHTNEKKDHFISVGKTRLRGKVTAVGKVTALDSRSKR